MNTSPETSSAYQACERITREQARNFSYGIQLLPKPKRAALSAVYAFARRVDDIGDGALPDARKLAALEAMRAQLRELAAHPDDPVLVALHDAACRFELPLAAFDELIDGCRADVLGTSYASFTELRHYCRCVAGSIGRLSLGVFGSREPEVDEHLADTLGLALQLTNILRDVLEDRKAGRIYLPADELARFGCTFEVGSDGELNDETEALARLVAYQVARAEDLYAIGLSLLPRLDRRSRSCCAAMAGIYHRLLHRMALHPELIRRQRTTLPDWEKAAVAARALAGAAI